jgi:hypothetical protein
LGIIENNELWLTERNHMNDVYDEEYIKRIVKGIQNKKYNKDFKNSMLDCNFIDGRPQYGFSTSLENDVAHQWMNYSNSSPICVEFRRDEFFGFNNLGRGEG